MLGWFGVEKVEHILELYHCSESFGLVAGERAV